MADLSKLTLPIWDAQQETYVPTEFDLKDAAAREMIEDLGNALYWMGVTTTELSEGATTNPITIGGESKTAEIGGMAQYDGNEYVWNGSAWQGMGPANFGSLAFKSSASGSYTPTGNVSVESTGAGTANVNSITGVGTLPGWTVSGETAVFNAGTLPTQGEAQTVLTNVGTLSGSFTGTAATVTVS